VTGAEELTRSDLRENALQIKKESLHADPLVASLTLGSPSTSLRASVHRDDSGGKSARKLFHELQTY
jgi:hypothetical protein